MSTFRHHKFAMERCNDRSNDRLADLATDGSVSDSRNDSVEVSKFANFDDSEKVGTRHGEMRAKAVDSHCGISLVCVSRKESERQRN